jgi:hypothetical protein
LVGLRELTPALRDQVMVTSEDRALLEARAASGGAHAIPVSPWRQVLSPDILLPALGISVFNLIYYAAIGFSTIYLTTIYGFSTHTVNGINTWFWSINAAALVVAGVMSDRLRVRKPFMMVGVGLTAVMTFVFLSRATRPDTSSLTMVLILGQLAIGLALTYVPWMAAFTETIERRSPALMATGLAVWGWLVRLSVCVSFLVLPSVVRSMNTLVNAPAVLAQAKALPPDASPSFTLTSELARIRSAKVDAPLEWQHWWWICIAAELLFVLLALPLAGRWSTRAAQADLEAHRRRTRTLTESIPPLDDPADVGPAPSPSPAALSEVLEIDVEAARHFASKMNAAESRWFVMYGAASRSYWAFPLWDPGIALVLENPSPQRLQVAMREAEARYIGR